MRSISLEEYIAETQDFCSMSRKENTIPVIEKPALPGRKPISLKYSYGRALIIRGSIGFREHQSTMARPQWESSGQLT
nr:hypothetical protein [Clostridia bacterium]